MKNAFILSLLFVLFGTFSFAQNQVTDTSTTIVSYWKKGEKKVFLVQQSKEKFVDGVLKTNSKSSYEAHVEVLSESSAGYTIAWTYKNVGTRVVESPAQAKIAKITENLKVIYTIDELGTFLSVKNWKEIRDQINAAIGIIEKEHSTDEAVVAACKAVKGLYQSQEFIEQIVIKDIQLYHMTYGSEYVLEQKESVETLLPNVFGGDPIPALMSWELTDLDKQKNYCKLNVWQAIDDEKATEVIIDLLKRLMSAMGEELPKEGDIPTFEINDMNEFEVELESGWIKRAYYERKAEALNIVQIETMEITLVK